ncbi:YoaK family protein [Atopobacter phocae]|uniref:YoaK family protein n=1 Tax=Atopobacter phocae TaxID=136492 RepID=UPI000470B069|nr:YoaK family protein [Atopobacter phocae]
MIWILLLTAWAGYINSLALLTFSRTVSHHSGNLTNLGITIGTGDDLWTIIQLLGIVLSYVSGAISSEIIFGRLTRDRRHLSKRLSSILVLIGIGFIGLARGESQLAFIMYFAFLMGGQNGYSLQVYNKLVRTTHMTGYLTDVGILIGQWILEKRTNVPLLCFYIASLMLFVMGAAGAVVVSQIVGWEDHVLLIAIGYIISGLLLAIRTMQVVGLKTSKKEANNQ